MKSRWVKPRAWRRRRRRCRDGPLLQSDAWCVYSSPLSYRPWIRVDSRSSRIDTNPLRTRCPLADRLKIRTSVLQMVIYGEIDRLLTPKFSHPSLSHPSTGLRALCHKKQTIRQSKWPDLYGARTAHWYRPSISSPFDTRSLTLRHTERGIFLRYRGLSPVECTCQGDTISHIDMGDDHIDTVISHIISPYPISICHIDLPY